MGGCADGVVGGVGVFPCLSARASRHRICQLLCSSCLFDGVCFFNEQALVLSEPTLFLDALWIPHRRNNVEMEGLLRSKEARGAR